MLSDIQRPVSASVVKSIWRSVLAGNSTPIDPTFVFPEKDFYSTDFTGIADATLLRSLPGWSAYNSAASTNVARDLWYVQSGIIQSTATEDFDPAPGKFIIGRDTGSTDHVIKAVLKATPISGRYLTVVVAGTDQLNCVYFQCTASASAMGSLIIKKVSAGVTTQLFSVAGISSNLGRNLAVGDSVELKVVGQIVHLSIAGSVITPISGVDLDTGGAFVKGTRAGFGTAYNKNTAWDEVYIAAAAASVQVNSTQIFWPGSIPQWGRAIPLSGKYAGDATNLAYRVVNADSLAVVKDWALVTDAVISGGDWSAKAFAPMSSTATNPRCRIQVAATSDVDSYGSTNKIAVGLCIGNYGQSNATGRNSSGAATSHAVANAYSWSPENQSVWQGGDSTTVRRCQIMASKLAAASGVPAGVLGLGEGATFIHQLNTRGDGVFYLLDDNEAKAVTANAFGYVSSWLWTQGEAEAGSGVFNVESYRSNIDTLLAELRAGMSGGYSSSFGVCIIGRREDSYAGDDGWSAARKCQFELTDKPGVYVSTNLNGLPMVDSLHYTADAYVESCRRAGMSMAKAMGYGGFDGRGPIVTGVSRSGAVVTLAVDLNGATSLSGTGLTNYDVSVNDFSTLLPKTSVEVVGASIVITLAADPGATVKVRSFWGMKYGTPVLAIGAYSDGTTIPVEPIFSAITSD